MKQAEISVLNGLYKNAAVGKDAIFCVIRCHLLLQKMPSFA